LAGGRSLKYCISRSRSVRIPLSTSSPRLRHDGDEGFFESSYVQKLLREHTEGVRDDRKLLWTLLVFELWQEKYLRR
jgi:hypothetical protein